MNTKQIVRLRKKKLSSGNQSLYLDKYVNGIREYEFLKLYIIPERTHADKEANRRTLLTAEQIRVERQIDILNGKSSLQHAKLTPVLTEYIYDKHWNDRENTLHSYIYLISNIRDFRDNKVTLAQIDRDYCIAFVNYIKKRHAQNTAWHLYTKFNSILNAAVKDGIISHNPCVIPNNIRPKAKAGEREYLTENELKSLFETTCLNEEVKRAFLFSCLTGLRFIDIETLKWSDIKEGEIVKEQTKTGNIVIVPLSETATALLPLKDDKYVFHLPSRECCRWNLKKWVAKAGIKKHITFHCARHTFATLLMTNGSDLFTTSRLLGHKDVKTTQIYAKLVDEKRREAVSKLPSFTI